MAAGDPTTPPTTSTTANPVVDPTSADILNSITDATAQNQQALNSWSGIADIAKTVLTGFNDQMVKAGVNLQSGQVLTDNQTTAFGLLSSSVLGARKAFDNLNGIDTNRINTFTKQWTDLQSILNNSPGAKTGAAGIQLTVDALVKIGAPMDRIKEAAAGGITVLTKYAASFFESADNAIRLQDTIQQLASRTGSLNEMYKAAGPNLSNLNQLTENYQKAINDASDATHVGRDLIEQYYAQIAAVPGALQATVQSANDATTSVSLLTAATELANGSGRSMTDIAADLRIAFRDYHITTGDEAIRFSARMTEINNKFGIEIADVRNALTSTAESFKMFGNEAEGAAKMMNQYLGALESTGLSGATALGVIQKMTSGIQGMTIAQKSFLSSQTGGPGGLMGGYQIEQMLRDGQIDQVMEKVRTTLTQRMGPLVSLQEASQSPEAAAQMTKQIAMLKQGPLGQFAQDDQSAMRLIEAMKNQQAGVTGATITDLAGTGEKGSTQDLMKEGINWQERTHSVLTDIDDKIRNMQALGGVANLTTAQQSMTAVAGAQMSTGDVNGQLRRDLLRGSEMGANASGRSTKDLDTSLQSGILTTRETSGQVIAGSIKDLISVAKEIPEAIKGPINAMSAMLNKGNEAGAVNIYKQGVASLDAQKKVVQTNLVGQDQKTRLTEIEDQKNMLFTSLKEGMTRLPEIQLNNAASVMSDRQANNLGDIASVVANKQAANPLDKLVSDTKTVMARHPTTAADDTSGKNLGQITVHIEGYCLDCGEKIKGSNQGYAVNPAGSTTGHH